FTLASPAEVQRFVAILRELRAEPSCYLVLALRADFYGTFMDSALWPEAPGMSRLDVVPLRGAALAQAIRDPARAVRVYLEAPLCDRLVADAAEEPGVLPLVQETLRLLWDRRRERFLGLDAYEALGRGGRALDVAIARRAATAMAGLGATEQTIARRVLLRLVSFGEGRPDTRRQQEVAALRSADDDDEDFSRVLRQLVEHRLITVGEAEPDHGALADLSHEALITGWPELQMWIARRRADEQRRRRLEAKVGEWIEHGRGTASLLDAIELAEARAWLQSDAARELGFGPELPELVQASGAELARLERQRRRRTARAIALLVGFTLVASSLAVMAWQQRRDAQRSGALAQQRLGMRYLEAGRAYVVADHPMQALPFLIEARAQGIDGRILELLFAQAASNLPLVTLAGHGSFVTGAAFSPEGARLLTISNEQVRLWDSATGKALAPPLVHRGPVQMAVFSPDGTRLATASYDLTAQVWDAATGKQVTPPLVHQGLVHGVAFSADGASLVTAGGDLTARVWDATTGALRLTLPHAAPVTAVAFSPDGSRVVTASEDRVARIWDAATGTQLIARLAHDGVVTAAAFSRNGAYIATASEDMTARVWDATTGAPITAPLVHDASVIAAGFDRDGARLVTASGDRAQVWDAASGTPVGEPLVHTGLVTSARFSPDGTWVVTASADHTARVWDAATGQPLVVLEHQDAIADAAFSPDGTRVVTASEDGTARVW
ncbi:MAG TPA: WD40 repeat domain-containing protein, partial [Kofleriaceae bacterium]